MERILNITNGDNAVSLLKNANLPGQHLPWRDILHEGPVPAGMELEKLSEIRARFIIEQGWGEPQQIIDSFTERDKLLRRYAQFDRLILWFEHDLYDQLQLIQILHFIKNHPAQNTRVSLICTEQYLGMATVEQMDYLLSAERPVNADQLDLADRAWRAFTSADPEQLLLLLDSPGDALPYLKDALKRLLEEYPSCTSGLSRTGEQALKIIAQGVTKPAQVFGRYQQSEERRFLGDSSFWALLRQFLASSPALLELAGTDHLYLPATSDQSLSITQAGKDVLSGKRNWLDIMPADRWIGGVHLQADNLWCYEIQTGNLLYRNQQE